MKRISFTFNLFFLLYFLPNMAFAQEISPTLSNYPGGYNISCHGANNGFINIVVVGDAPPFLYNWSNGATTKNITQLVAGNYTLIVTDANSNTVSMDFDLSQPNTIGVILHPRVFEGGHNIPEPGGYDGLIETDISGGVSPYSYSWNNNTTEQNLEGVPAGTYTLTVTDMNGCTSSASATLTEASELHVTSITSPSQNGYNISCRGVKDGTIQLNVAGGTPPYEFTWMDGYQEKDRSELGAGNYTVIIRDANGIAEAAQILLTEPAELQTQLSPTIYANTKHISCYGCANGHITSTVTGGVSPYTYLWNDGATSTNRNGLVQGQYNVQITDANGCVIEAGLNIIGPEREDWTMSGNSGTNSSINFVGTSDNQDLVLRTNNTERIRVKGTGQIEFNNYLKIDNTSSDSLRSVYVDQQGLLRVSSASGGQQPCTSPTNKWVTNYCTSGNDIYNLPSTGNVGIGTSQIPVGYKLAVNGKIICEEVKVKLSSAWPDYVFHKDYKLMPLSELKKFVDERNHLPEIPTANEVEIDGSSIGDMQSKLLQKIEELTLYLVQQNEKLEKLENDNVLLSRKVDVLSAKEIR